MNLYASDEVEELDLSANHQLRRIDFIQGYPNLVRLDLSLCDHIENNYKAVASLTKLEELRLDNIRLTKTKYLLPLVELTHLDISHNGGFRSLKHIVQLTSITRLNLSGNVQITDLTPLTKLPDLVHFEFEYILDDKDSDESIFRPIGQLRKLRKLNIGHNTYLRNIRFLDNISHLEMLDVTGDQCIKDGKIIGNLDKLRKLKMPFTVQQDISYVTKLTDLEKLVIDRDVRDFEFRHKLRRLCDLVIR